MAIEMVTGPRTIQNTWPLASISNRTRDINSWKIGFSHWAFWNILITRTIVRVMITFRESWIEIWMTGRDMFLSWYICLSGSMVGRQCIKLEIWGSDPSFKTQIFLSIFIRKICYFRYDFYEMLMDISNNNLKEESSVPRFGKIGSSPFRKISDKRTCEGAGIPDEYCICARETQLSTNDTRVKTIAQDLVSYVNYLLESNIEPTLCTHLELTSILSAQLLSLGPQSARPQGFRVLYRVMIQVSPSDALFEGTLEMDAWSERGLVVGDVNRINRYGNQSHCISDRILKLYCFCSDLL